MTRRLASTEHGELGRAEREIRARIGERPFDFRAMAAISNIYRAATPMRHHMEQGVLAARNLSWAAFTVLWVLWIWGEQEPGQLAAETGTTKASLSGVLKTLEGRGLVVRCAHPADGRRVLLGLSPAGLETIEAVFPRFNAEEAFASSALSGAEQEQLAHLLRQVTATIDPGAWR